MARQMVYPKYYPQGDFGTTRKQAWDFLRLNQDTATEAIVVWFNSECKRVGYNAMAKNAKAQGKATASDKADWVGFANVDLTPDDKKAIAGGVLDGDAVLDIIADMLATGHKLTINFDAQRDTVQGSVTGVYKSCKNAGLTMTSFARDVTGLLTVIAYKQDVVTRGDWSKFVQHKRDVEDFG